MNLHVMFVIKLSSESTVREHVDRCQYQFLGLFTEHANQVLVNPAGWMTINMPIMYNVNYCIYYY